MAELFRHTDEDGDRIDVLPLGCIGDGRGLGVLIGRGVARKAAVHLDEAAGRRLLDALRRHYETSPEVDHAG